MSAAQVFHDGRVTLHGGDCRDVLAALPDGSIDSIVTDPPYALVSIGRRFGKPGSAATKAGAVYARASSGFMGQQWDTGETAFSVAFWAQALRVLKPGGHVVAFGGTRAHHHMWLAIEQAGFEIRDSLLHLFDLDPIVEAFFLSLDAGQQQTFLYIMDQLGPGGLLAWVYGSGFPKSHDVAKGIDKRLGHERAKVRIPAAAVGNLKARQDLRPFILAAQQRGYHEAASAEAALWQGWGTALKPAWEPIALARKPLAGTVAANVLAHGVGALNIDGCRVGMSDSDAAAIDGRVFVGSPASPSIGKFATEGSDKVIRAHPSGRWPANIVHDGSDEVVAAFPPTAPASSGKPRGAAAGEGWGMTATGAEYDDAGGSAARFFYSAKADADDRIGSKHPTVKPVDLMQWLCRLVTPPGGVVLDPFAGSGTTGEAAFREGFRAVLCEREPAYQADIARRMALAGEGPAARRAGRAAARQAGKESDHGPLFGGSDPAGAGGSTAASPIRTDDRAGRIEEVML